MRHYVFGIPLHPVSFTLVLQRIGKARQRRQMLCIDTINTMIISEAAMNQSFRQALTQFDLLIPDATPLGWYLKLLKAPKVNVCYGPILTEKVLKKFSSKSKIVIIGSSQKNKQLYEKKFKRSHVWITDRIDPGNPSHIRSLVKKIRRENPDIVFLALGCPKQEFVMAKLKPYLKCGVYIGVGGSFDLLAGVRPMAPEVIRKIGLNWLFKFILEPGRLWKRYLVYNSLFLFLCLKYFRADRRLVRSLR